jgi:hypothetical protein
MAIALAARLGGVLSPVVPPPPSPSHDCRLLALFSVALSLSTARRLRRAEAERAEVEAGHATAIAHLAARVDVVEADVVALRGSLRGHESTLASHAAQLRQLGRTRRRTDLAVDVVAAVVALAVAVRASAALAGVLTLVMGPPRLRPPPSTRREARALRPRSSSWLVDFLTALLPGAARAGTTAAVAAWVFARITAAAKRAGVRTAADTADGLAWLLVRGEEGADG